MIAVRYCDVRFAPRQIGDSPGTVRSRDEAVVCRDHVGVLLRTIDLEITSLFVHLIFDRVARNDLDENRYFFRGAIANLDAVPRMRFVGSEHGPYYLAGETKCLTA